MKLQRILTYAAAIGLAGFAAHAYLQDSAATPLAHDPATDHRREIVREVARSFESMAQAGKDLPVPKPERLRSLASLGSAHTEWGDFASKKGVADYETELQTHGDSSAASVAIQRLMLLNRMDNEGNIEQAMGFAQEAFTELRAHPDETVQAIGRLLDSMPADRGAERIYLLQLGSRLDDPGSPVHSQVAALLRAEIAQGPSGNVDPSGRSSASAAVIELVNMGEPLPDVSEIAKQDPAVSEILTRKPQPQQAAAGDPQGN